MNIFITGIAGSGGSYLADYLVENHPEVNVHGSVRWHSTANKSNVEHIKDKITLHECDLLDLGSIIRVFREVQPERIFNLASHANVRICFDNPLAVYQNNVTLMTNLLEATRMECPDAIFQQCYTSEVYGTPASTPITERHPLMPPNPYAASKLSQEALAYAYWRSWKVKVVITRMFAYINPRRVDLFASAFANQIARIEQGKQETLSHGNLESVRTLIDVRDAMRAYWIACDKCKYGVPYNVGGTNSMSVGQFLDILKSRARVPIVSRTDDKLLRNVDMTLQIPDTSKFDCLTGFKTKYSLEESTDWLLDYFRRKVNNETL